MIHKVLVVDDDDITRRALRIHLSSMSIQVDSVGSGRDAITQISSHPESYSAIIIDNRLPDISGANLTREVLEIKRDLIIIIYSGDVSEDSRRDCLAAGAAEVVEKDKVVTLFDEAVRNACRAYEQKRGNSV
jgi:two-component system, sensor histidine kinase